MGKSYKIIVGGNKIPNERKEGEQKNKKSRKGTEIIID